MRHKRRHLSRTSVCGQISRDDSLVELITETDCLKCLDRIANPPRSEKKKMPFKGFHGNKYR